MPIHLIYFGIFFLGLSAGSFLNCVIYRMELQENMPRSSPRRKAVSFLRGKSFCPHCKHILNWADLIPVLSFIFLRGKCRYCQKPISWQYPLVEIATGSLFLLIFNFQFSIFNQFSILNFLNLIFYWIISSFLIVIFVYDLKHYIIPDKVIYPAIGITFIYQLFRVLNFQFILKFGFWNLDFKNLINPTLSAILASVFFLTIVLVSQGKWMGVGDIKLAFLMGLILGWPNILTALFLAFFIGATIGIGLMISGKKTLKSEVPFGPFLVTSTFLALFFGKQIVDWYLNLFLI